MCLQAFRTTRPNDFPIERDHDQSIFPCRKQQQAGSEGGFELLIRVVSGQTWSVGPHWSHSVLTTRGPGTLLCRLPGAAQLREPGGHSQGGGRPSLTAAPGWLDHQRGRLVLQGVHPVQRGRAEVRRAAWGGGWGQPGELQEWRYGRRALFTAILYRQNESFKSEFWPNFFDWCCGYCVVHRAAQLHLFYMLELDRPL